MIAFTSTINELKMNGWLSYVKSMQTEAVFAKKISINVSGSCCRSKVLLVRVLIDHSLYR